MNSKKNSNMLEIIDKLMQEIRREKLVFILVGRTGVGKSSTINSILGKEVAKIGHYEPTTMEIKFYDSIVEDIKFTVVDTPGLCDDLEEAGNDENYMELMRSEVRQIDAILFISRLDEPRLARDEKKAIKLISTLSSNVWDNAVIILTFADKVLPSKYKEALQERTRLIRAEIAKCTGHQVADDIPSVAISNTMETTPDGEKWLAELYTQVFVKVSKRGTILFTLATMDSIKQRVSFNNSQKALIRTKFAESIITYTGLGISIGSVFGGVVGGATGGIVGSLIGFWRSQLSD